MATETPMKKKSSKRVLSELLDDEIPSERNDATRKIRRLLPKLERGVSSKGGNTNSLKISDKELRQRLAFHATDTNQLSNNTGEFIRSLSQSKRRN